MTQPPRRIDHIVAAVHDLDAAGAFYERLGFTVGARNRHPWGTENRLIQFGGSFVELITVGPDAGAIPEHKAGRFSFGAFVRDYLRAREGMAMLALASDDARADAERFARQGIGAFEPFSFERAGRRPDGSETRVAFTLAFATDARAPDAGFFVCQQHYPENFWNPAFQRHANGASGIAVIGMAAAAPEEHADFLAAFSGSAARRGADGSVSVELLGSRVDLVPETGERSGARFRFLTIHLPDPAAQAERLVENGVPFTGEGDGLRIPAEAALGVEIRFERGTAS